MIWLPILLPVICMFSIFVFGRNVKEQYINNAVSMTTIVSMIISWMIAFGLVVIGEPILINWLTMVDFNITFGIQWLPISAYLSAILYTVFFMTLIFLQHDADVKGSGKRTIAFLCGGLFFNEIIFSGSYIEQIILGWMGVVFTGFVLNGGKVVTKDEDSLNNMLMLIMNLIAIVIFIAGVEMGNVFSMITETINNEEIKNLTVFGINPQEIVVYIFICSISIPLGIMPFNAWVEGAFSHSATVSSFIYGSLMLVATYALFHILSVIDISLEGRVGVAIFAVISMIISSLVAVSQRDIFKVSAHIYSTVSCMVLFAFAVSSAEYAMLFSVIQFIGIVTFVLVIGAISTSLSGERDMTKMGGLAQKLPGIYFVYFVVVLSLLSIPPFSGSFARTWILSNSLIEQEYVLWSLLLFMFVGQFLLARTFGYILGMIFYGDEQVDDMVLAHLEKPAYSTLFSLSSMAIMLLFVGWIAEKILFNGGTVENQVSTMFSVLEIFGSLIVSVSGLIYGFKKTITKQKLNNKVFDTDGILVNNLYIKDSMIMLLFIPIKYIGITFEIMERPVFGRLISNFVVKLMTQITKLTDIIFKLPIVLSMVIGLIVFAGMVALFAFGIGR